MLLVNNLNKTFIILIAFRVLQSCYDFRLLLIYSIKTFIRAIRNSHSLISDRVGVEQCPESKCTILSNHYAISVLCWLQCLRTVLLVSWCYCSPCLIRNDYIRIVHYFSLVVCTCWWCLSAYVTLTQCVVPSVHNAKRNGPPPTHTPVSFLSFFASRLRLQH